MCKHKTVNTPYANVIIFNYYNGCDSALGLTIKTRGAVCCRWVKVNYNVALSGQH